MTVLDDIVLGVRADLAARMAHVPLSDVRARAEAAAAAREVVSAFTRPNFGVIAEVKRRSPSKGDLAEISDPAALARAYALGGAAAISVLTESRRFGGSLADFDAVRAAVSTPLLRKDFIVDEYQVWEARAHGADLVLLIVAALEQAELESLHELILGLGMTPLVEVHDEAELARAGQLDLRLLGVNNRNLKTLEVDQAAFLRLAPLAPSGIALIAESGISSGDDVQRFAEAGAAGVLVGEALVKSGEPSLRVSEFTSRGRAARK